MTSRNLSFCVLLRREKAAQQPLLSSSLSNRDGQPEQATFCRSVVQLSGSTKTPRSFLIIDQKGADTTDSLALHFSLWEPM